MIGIRENNAVYSNNKSAFDKIILFHFHIVNICLNENCRQITITFSPKIFALDICNSSFGGYDSASSFMYMFCR